MTLFVRRAFTYVAGDNWGIVRAGQADGLISIFDNGVTQFQFLPTGNLNGGDLQNHATKYSSQPSCSWSQAGNEYANAKAVYLSPRDRRASTLVSSMRPTRRTASGLKAAASNSLNVSRSTGSGTCSPGLAAAIRELGMSVLVRRPGYL